MKKNYSPWLYQLRTDRVSQKLERDETTDVAIIGAGIAGVATAFFTLKYTDKKILMLERYKLAHGATGHNAGQVVSYFERGFASLVDEFGIECAAKGQQAIEDAWGLLDEMYTDAGLNIPFSRFLGHAGLSSFEQVLLHLKNNYWRKKAGLNTERIWISDRADFLPDMPAEYAGLYEVVPQKNVLELLETDNQSFVAVLSYQKGCVNSALFCEEVMLYLLKKYPERFTLCELTPITKIILRKDKAIIDAGSHTVTAERVVLCTNGFTGFHIINETGLEINTKFHHLVHGTVGYMSGYIEKMNKTPIAISYLTDPDPSTDDPYFYLTRRFYEYGGEKNVNLISIGGPEVKLDDLTRYSHEHEYPDEIISSIDEFVRKVYVPEPNKKIDYEFTWHGLMGYTKNGIRLIGTEPKNPVLMYNLGCNGVGILPSVYGGKRIAYLCAQALEESAEPVEPTMFDVPREYED
jgi:glycine/D-amino acid oxidase-like deaminating enzyme